jgi:hypothetical protein
MLLIIVVGWLVTVGVLALLITARPAGPVLAAFLCACVLSVVVYLLPPGIHGRDDFHTRAAIAVPLAALLGAALGWRSRRLPDTLAYAFVGVLGVGTPPLLLFSLLTAACWGQTNCIG